MQVVKRLEYRPPVEAELVADYDVQIGNERHPAKCKVRIFYGAGKGFYRVEEPHLGPERAEKLEKALSFFLNEIPPTEIAQLDPVGYLEAELAKLGVFKGLDEGEREAIRYYIVREVRGYGTVTPPLFDPFVEDVSCEGEGRPVRVWHSRFNRFGWLETNIVLKGEELDSLLMRFATRSGRSLSTASPVLDSTLPEGFRVSGTWRKEVSSFGSSFTVRKYRRKPYSLTELIVMGSLDAKIAAYLWQLMEFKGFIMVVGASATGKTTMLNGLATLLNPNWKVVSIEDVRELNIPHPGWKALHTRPGGRNGEGRVELFDLVKLSLRERPDYVILGEARGEEMKILFQSAATGHGCLTTFHASGERALQARLTQPPISIPQSLLNLIDAVVFLVNDVKEGRRYVSRVVEYDDGWRTVYSKEGQGWRGNVGNKASMLAEAHGMDARSLVSSLERKEEFLLEMVDRGIFDYEEFSKHLALFYSL